MVSDKRQRLIHSSSSFKSTSKPHLGEATSVILLYEMHWNKTQKNTYRTSFSPFSALTVMPQLTGTQAQLQQAAEPCPIKLWHQQGWEIWHARWATSFSDCPPLFTCPVTLFHSLELLNCFSAKSWGYVTSMHSIWQLILLSMKKNLYAC